MPTTEFCSNQLNFYMYFMSTEHVTDPAPLIVLCLVAQIVLAAIYKLLSFSHWNVPQSFCYSICCRANILEIFLRNINITFCLFIADVTFLDVWAWAVEVLLVRSPIVLDWAPQQVWKTLIFAKLGKNVTIL